jgi:5'(3')-deoxyribonucleotidase
MKNHLTKNQIQFILDALEKKIGRKLLLVDLDGVVADFDSGVEKWARNIGISGEEFKKNKMYRQKHFYLDLELIPGAKESLLRLDSKYEIAFVSAPSWNNPHSFTEKRIWIEKFFGRWGEKRMDLSFRKGLYMGHFLVDDRTKYGAGDFIGEHIMFGTDPFKTWTETENYLLSNK